MGSFAEPLLYEIVRSAPDPDPKRAFRYRPFVYGPLRRDDGLPVRSRPALVARGMDRLRAAVAGLVGGVSVPATSPARESSCAPACC